MRVQSQQDFLSGMQPRPSFDRGLLIPIAVGVVSLLGLVWIFSASDLAETIFPPAAVPTATTTPSSVTPIETRTRSPFSLKTTTPEETSFTTTGTNPASYPGLPEETLPATSTLAVSTLDTETRPVPSATLTPDLGPPFPVGRYDDTDPGITYDRYWELLKNPGTANAYKGTIHSSYSIGSEVTFRFTGQRLYLGYQRGRNFGIVTVIIDSQSYSFHEQAFDLIWRSPQLSEGTHFVRIIHESGEAVNLDYIEVLD
jgi:hypothetical protein